MKNKTQNVTFVAVFILSAVIAFFVARFLSTPSKPEATCELITEPVPEMVVMNDSVSTPLFVYDSAAFLRSFEPWTIISENFNASYRDSSFLGSYQLVYPLESPYDTLKDSEFDRLLLSNLFGESAPKKVNRKSIQAVLEKMMKQDLKNTHSWWNESKARYGKRWRDEVCRCSGYFYAMPTERTSRWVSFQQISDYRCGGNGGPDEKYYTIIIGKRRELMDSTELLSWNGPYIADTTVFVPGFRDELVEMITDYVIHNFYGHDVGRKIGRNEIRKATAEEFKGDFALSLTLSGVKFLYSTWALPNTSHADGRVSVIVPYGMIQKLFTEKFKKDIELYW